MRFDNEMYNDMVGSYVIASYMYGKGTNAKGIPTLQFLKKRWTEYKRRMRNNDVPIPKLSVNDIEKYFKLPRIHPPVALYQSGFHGVFLLVIDNTPLPIREDGVFPRSYYKHDNVILVDWSKEKNVEEE